VAPNTRMAPDPESVSAAPRYMTDKTIRIFEHDMRCAIRTAVDHRQTACLRPGQYCAPLRRQRHHSHP
jgi:hypothetical protein